MNDCKDVAKRAWGCMSRNAELLNPMKVSPEDENLLQKLAKLYLIMLVGKWGSFKLKSWYKNDKSLSLNVAPCLIFQAVLRGSCGLIHGGLRMKSPEDAQFYGRKLEHADLLIDSCCFLRPDTNRCSVWSLCYRRTRAESVSVAAFGRQQRTVCTPLILKRHDRRVIEFPAAATKINSPQPLRHGIAILENTTQYYCNNNAPK